MRRSLASAQRASIGRDYVSTGITILRNKELPLGVGTARNNQILYWSGARVSWWHQQHVLCRSVKAWQVQLFGQ